MSLQGEDRIWSLGELFLQECEIARIDGVQEPFETGDRLRWVTSLEPKVEQWMIVSFAQTLSPDENCFLNTREASQSDGVYTEGVSRAIDGRWYHHSFLTAGSLVIETTWRYLGQNYTGVQFTEEEITQWQGKGPSMSMLWGSEVLWLCNKE